MVRTSGTVDDALSGETFEEHLLFILKAGAAKSYRGKGRVRGGGKEIVRTLFGIFRRYRKLKQMLSKRNSDLRPFAYEGMQ